MALSAYFLPGRSSKPVLTPSRPRIIKWYCPFAAQREFPSGHRYCINVYSGCSYGCEYCYATSYAPQNARPKRGFEELIDRDMEDLERFDVPPAPVHLSNSTDPYQPLEAEYHHTEHALRRILEHRLHFTTVVILTKNPLGAIESGHLDLLKTLGEIPDDHTSARILRSRGQPGLVVEVSLAFADDRAAAFYDRFAPPVEQRLAGIEALRREGLAVVLRIDPLFPRSPLGGLDRRGLVDFDLPEAQRLEDLANLVRFARQVGVSHIVYSTMKIVQPRGRRLSQAVRSLRQMYEAITAPAKPIFRGGSWRLPRPIADRLVVRPFLEICEREGVPAKFCMQNLTETP